MTTLPAVPNTTGEVTGRLEMLNGELVVRLRPARVRDVTATPIHPEPAQQPHEYRFRCCDHHYFGSCGVPPTQTEVDRLDAYWMDPPLWSSLRWIPSQRRLRALEKRERALLAATQRLELETREKEVVT